MGRTITPKYALTVKVESGRYYTPMAWTVREDGPATVAGLSRWIEAFEASTAQGGANAHLGVERITSARITLNVSGGEIVAQVAR
jgi:hypothetical protein